MRTLRETTFTPDVRRGKVRDIYEGPDSTVALITTDRISAFDRVLNQQVPYKGQSLNASSQYTFLTTTDIVENHYVAMPHPNVMIVRKYEPYPVEVVIRAYLSGSSWRDYKKGKRKFFDITLPDGLRQNQNLIDVVGGPIHTPTTKAEIGKHDEDITPEDVEGLVGKKSWQRMREIGTALFLRANEMTARNGYVEPDTKYEFGYRPDIGIILIDEANTHDSSRFFKSDNYMERFEAGEDLAWVDKEFVRNYLKSIRFMGDGPIPDLPPEIVEGASQRLLESVYALTGQHFTPIEPDEKEITEVLRKYGFIQE